MPDVTDLKQVARAVLRLADQLQQAHHYDIQDGQVCGQQELANICKTEHKAVILLTPQKLSSG